MMAPPNATKFGIPDPLWRVLHHFETDCVGGCCGRRAFVFTADGPVPLTRAVSPEELRVARRQLDELIVSLRAIPGPVDTPMIRGTWNGPRAAQWFTVIMKFLDAHYDIARPANPADRAGG